MKIDLGKTCLLTLLGSMYMCPQPQYLVSTLRAILWNIAASLMLLMSSTARPIYTEDCVYASNSMQSIL